jgi:hypothetical protein
MWNDGLKKFNTNFDEMMYKVLDFIEYNEPDKVIVTRFEDFGPELEHSPLLQLCNSLAIPIEFKEYGYGFYRDPEDDGEERYPTLQFNETWTYGTRDHHGEEDVLEIHDWHHAIKRNNDTVMLAGAFVDECLLDAQTVMDTLGIPYTDIEGLQVGSGVEYEFMLEPEEEEPEDEYNDELDDEYDDYSPAA